MRALYGSCRELAAGFMSRERGGHTLQPTALVHEAYLRIVELHDIEWRDPTRFLAVAAGVIRRLLVDYARQHRAQKRKGGGLVLRLNGDPATNGHVTVDAIDLDEALSDLAAESPTGARAARAIELRFFGGLEVCEVAVIMEVSERTVYGDWRYAKAWLSQRLKGYADEFGPSRENARAASRSEQSPGG